MLLRSGISPWPTGLGWARIILLYLFTTKLLQSTRGELQAPQFLSQPSNITSSLAALLPCTASGDPTPTIIWFRDGSLLDVGGDPRLNPTAVGLEVQELQGVGGEGLEGVYHCEANNSVGSVRSTPASLARSVWVLGFSGVRNNETNIKRFSSTILTCRRPQVSVPRASITWAGPQLGNEGVGVALDGRLFFSSYDPSNQGLFEDYTCTVSNPVSGQTVASERFRMFDVTAATLLHNTKIVVPPALGQMAVVVGDDITLDCFTSGHPVAEVSWALNGSEISTSGGHFQTLQGARQLLIVGVRPEDAGTYTCSAERRREFTNDRDTKSTMLLVTVPPKIIASFPEVSANVTNALSVSCTAEGTLPLQWSWRRDTHLVAQSDRVSYEAAGSSSTLTFTSLKEEDRGVYQCTTFQPNSGRQHAYNQFIDVRVVAPVFLPSSSAFQDVLVIANSSVSLPCMATGFPPPTFSWVRNLGNNDLKDIILENRFSIPAPGMGDGTLTIFPAQVSDSSTLICRASNSVSQGPISNKDITLRVIGQPTVLQYPPSSLIPVDEETVILPCEASATNGIRVRYRWTKDHTLLVVDNEVNGNLAFPSVDKNGSNNGFYTCSIVLTFEGLDAEPLVYPIGTTVLTVQGPPSPPSKPGILPPISIDHSSFTARWTIPLDTGRLALTNYTLQLRNMGSNFCPLNMDTWAIVRTGIRPNVTNLEVNVDVYPGMGYQYRVIVFTALFSSHSEPSAVFLTPNSVPQAPPSDVTAIGVSDSEVRVSWNTPTSCTTYGGPLTAYSLRYSATSLLSSTFVTSGSTPTSHILTGLLSGTEYRVQVAANTEEGAGEYSSVVMATTLAGSSSPPPPLHVRNDVATSNSTAANITWFPPSLSFSSPLVNYVIKYVALDGTEHSTLVPPTQHSVLIGGLSPGRAYIFRVRAVYGNGTRSMPVNVTVDLAIEQGFLTQPWFYGVVAGGGALCLLIAGLLVACICCRACGNTIVHVKRSSSGVSNASSNFSEYRVKNKANGSSIPPRVERSSPPPNNHCTDYAIPNVLYNTYQRDQQHQQLQFLQNQFPPALCVVEPPCGGPATALPSTSPPSTGTPSMANLTSSATSSPQFSARNLPHTNTLTHGSHMQLQTGQGGPYEGRGGSSMQDYYDDSSAPEDYMSRAEELRKMSAETTQKFVDTLSRVHSPPPSSNHSHFQMQDFSSGHLTALSKQRESQWNSGVSGQGHMTSQPNNVGGHMTSQPNNVGGHMTSQPSNLGGHMTSQPNNVEGYMTSQFGVPREHFHSTEFRGATQLEQGSWGAKNLAPLTTQPFQNSRDFQEGYLIRADEIRIKELSSQGASMDEERRVWSGQSKVDHIGNNHIHIGKPHNEYSTAVPRVSSGSSGVQVSHNTSFESSSSIQHLAADDSSRSAQIYDILPSSSSNLDPVYDIPPSSTSNLDPTYDVPLSIGSEPNPVYDIPSSKPAQRKTPQPAKSSHPPPTFAAPLPPIETQTPLQSNLVKGSSSPHAQHVPPSHHQTRPLNQNLSSVNGTRTSSGQNSIPDQTRQLPSSSTRDPPTLSAASTSLLVSQASTCSLQSSIASGWSLDHIQKHMEKHAQGFNDLLASADEGSEGVDWDTPTGAHMNNSRYCNNFQSVDSPKPLVEFKYNGNDRRIAKEEEPIATDIPNDNHYCSTFRPAVSSKPQASSNRRLAASVREPAPTNKMGLKVPGPTSMIPQRPVLKGKHMPGGFWQPRSMNRAIQSSSEESVDSCCSRGSTVATDTLRSAHV